RFSRDWSSDVCSSDLRALVADLATGTGGRAGPGRNRGGMVVRFHLDGEVDALLDAAPHAIIRVGEEALAVAALDHRGVVRIGGRSEERRVGKRKSAKD